MFTLRIGAKQPAIELLLWAAVWPGARFDVSTGRLRCHAARRGARSFLGMGAMQNYVMHCDVRSWRASGVIFDKTHCDQRSNND